MRMTEKRLDTPRGPVAYWTNGDALPNRETLVFLHGLTADHTLFDKQAEHFAEAYNLIIWDAPAHGRSRPYSGFTYPNAAEDLKAILEANGIASAVMIGQSMGGYVIQSFLLRFPDMARAFVGIDTCPYGEGYYSASDKWWLRQVEWMSRLYPTGLLKRSVARQCTRSEYGYENMLSALSPYDKDELCRLMGIGYAGFLEDNRDMTIPCPALLICGRHDVTGKVRQYNEMWSAKTGLPLVWIENAAHNSNADAPNAVNAAIEEFLARLIKSSTNPFGFADEKAALRSRTRRPPVADNSHTLYAKCIFGTYTPRQKWIESYFAATAPRNSARLCLM